MTKYPLFGQDSVPQYTSRILSIAGTVIFWLIFLVVMICVKPAPKKPKYKEVQIVLSSTPLEKKQTESAAALEPAETVSQNIEQMVTEIVEQDVVKEPEPVKTVEKTVPNPAPIEKPQPTPARIEKPIEKPSVQPEAKKTAPAKPAEPKKESIKTVEQKPKPVVQSKPKQPEPTFTPENVDPMEAFEKQLNTNKKKTFDWNSMDDMSDQETEQANQKTDNYVKPLSNESTYSGAAAKEVAKPSLQKTTTPTTADNPVKTSSEDTNNILDKIAKTETKVSPKAEDGKSENKNDSVSENQNNGLKWSNGASRKMIVPKNPKLEISRENQSKVNYSEVSITFSVNADGYVTKSSIVTTPPISQSVLDEIAEQIADWWFSPGEGNATATLIWKIQRN